MTVKSYPPPYDPANPPAGKRLVLGSVSARLGVSLTDMAQATGISRAAISDVLLNHWPVRTERRQIEQQLMALMEARGCSDDELQRLFHAHGPQRADGQPGALRKGIPFVPRPAQQARCSQPDSDEEETMLLSKQSLSPAARKHFKLFTNPFGGEVTTDDAMFVGDDIAYCREAVWQAVQNGGFVSLIGESGAGKTTLLQDLEARLEHDAARSVIVIRPGVLGMEGNDTKGKAIKSADILHAVISRLDANAVMPQTLQARTVKANKLLTSSAQIGNLHLLVVEEAHSMPDATLKHLKRLHEMRLGRRPLLSILLLAQPELKTRLADGLRDGSLREVAQRVEIVELLPLDGQLKGYLERRAGAAGVPLAALMDDPAVEALRTRLTFKRVGGAISMCYPLAVNNLVTRALNAAADLGAPKVTKDVVAGC